MPPLSVHPLPLDDDQKKKVVDYFLGQFQEADGARSEMKKQWKRHVQQYNGRLAPERKTRYRAQIDVGLTREASQQSAARLVNPIVGQNPIHVCIPRFETYADFADEVQQLLDATEDVAKTPLLAEQWVKMSHQYHYAPVKVSWVVKRRTIKEWVQQEQPVLDASGQPMIQMIPDPTMPGMPMPVPITQPVWVEQCRQVDDVVGAVPECIAPEDFLFLPGSVSVTAAPWVAHRIQLPPWDVKRRVKAGEYEGDAAGKVEATTSRREDFAVEQKKLIGLDVSKQTSVTLHETYTTLAIIREALGEDDETVFSDETSGTVYDDSTEVILTIDETNQCMRRAVYNFFHAYPRPFVTWSYEGSRDSIEGISLAYILESHHKAYAGMVRQELDAQSAANEVCVLVRAGSDLTKAFENGELKGGMYEINGVPRDDVLPFSISQPRTTSPELRSEIAGRAERLAATNAFAFGQVTTSHISATGQMAQTQEATQPLFMVLESFREALATVAKIRVARYKQFYPEPEGLTYFLRQEQETEDGKRPVMVPGRIHWPQGDLEEQLVIETKVSSQTLNKEQQKQEKLALVQMLPNLQGMLRDLAMAVVTPNPLAPVAKKMLAGAQVAIDEYLDAFDIPNKELLNPNIEKEVQFGVWIQGLLAQVAQQGQALASLQGGGPAGPGDAPQPPQRGGGNPGPAGPPSSPAGLPPGPSPDAGFA